MYVGHSGCLTPAWSVYVGHSGWLTPAWSVYVGHSGWLTPAWSVYVGHSGWSTPVWSICMYVGHSRQSTLAWSTTVMKYTCVVMGRVHSFSEKSHSDTMLALRSCLVILTMSVQDLVSA